MASAALPPPLIIELRSIVRITELRSIVHIIELRSIVRVLLYQKGKANELRVWLDEPPAQTRDPQTVAFSSPPTSSSLSPCLTRASGRVAGCFASCFAVHFAFSTRLRLRLGFPPQPESHNVLITPLSHPGLRSRRRSLRLLNSTSTTTRMFRAATRVTQRIT